MTASARPGAVSGDYGSPGYAWATGIAAFGGIMLATVGVFHFIEGLAAVLSDDIFQAPRNYLFDFNLTSWGWIHMVIGVAAVGVGISIVVGWHWGYSIGVLIGVVSAISSFAFMPYYPLWASVSVAFDIVIIWALCRLMMSLRNQAEVRASDADFEMSPEAAQERPVRPPLT
jgi:hypothetical protein